MPDERQRMSGALRHGDRVIVSGWGVIEKAIASIIASICIAILFAVIGLRDDIKILKHDFGPLRETIADHETRLRVVERR